MADRNTIYFAETDFRNKNTRFGIKETDRMKHMYLIGKTGMGKSVTLENMAVQDIRNGSGIAFIDPHGKTAELLLEYIPKERIKDVVYFAPFDTEYPVSFNVLEDVGKDQRHLVADGLMAAFKKIWPDVWSARMEYILNNILLALLEYPDSTILGVNRMLSDKAYREMVVDNITDPAVKAFWTDEFARYTDKFMTEAGAAIQNKIGQFTASPIIRNLLGQSKSTFNIRDIMDTKKIFIMNLSKGRIGENNAGLIGGMLITKIYLAAMSRANVSDEDLSRLPPFFFYVDEFQTFVNDSFADILSEARKYKLALTIAHQYIEQMPEEVRNAVFGNVGTTISFRVGPFDAEVLEKIFAPKIMALDIVNLAAYQIYLTLMIDGIGSPPFSARTLPPIVPPETSHKQEAIEHSRSTYARPRDVVESEILEWHKPVGPSASGGHSSAPSFPRPSAPSFGNGVSYSGGGGGDGDRKRSRKRKRPGEGSGFGVTTPRPVMQGNVAPARQSGNTRPMNLKALIDQAIKAQDEENKQEESLEEEGIYKKEKVLQNSIINEPENEESDFEEENSDTASNQESQNSSNDAISVHSSTSKPKEIPEDELKKMLEV